MELEKQLNDKFDFDEALTHAYGEQMTLKEVIILTALLSLTISLYSAIKRKINQE